MATQQKQNNDPPADLMKLGFETADEESPRRLLVANDGLEKAGKSNLFLTAPGPIAGINLDIGLEGVVHKYTKNKKIWVMSYNLPPIVTGNAAADQKTYQSHYFEVKRAYDAIIAHKDVRTVFIDTSSELWDLIILAEFGTMTPQDRRGSLAFQTANNIFRGLIRSVYNTDKNLVITCKLGKEWIREKTADGKQTSAWSGNYQREGFRETDFLIQVNVTHWFDKATNKFGMRVINCRQNYELAGMEFPHGECDFAHLATAVFPDTELKDWR